MTRTISLLAIASVLTGCSQSNDGADSQTANSVQPKKKAAHCFFKDAEMKDWSAKRGKDGNIIVKGKVYRSDSRYKAAFGEPVIDGTSVELSPTLQQNSAAYGAPDDWWDVSAVVPNSAAIDTVRVSCGAKTFADIKVPVKG